MDDNNIRLWVFGDSFSASYPYFPDRVWTKQLASRLEDSLGTSVELRNCSLLGCSQDWITDRFFLEMEGISPRDYVIIVLTSAERYWFFEDKPEISNPNLIDLDDILSKEQTQAVEYYYRHIDRPHLSFLQAVTRLSAISYHSLKLGLRTPLILQGFGQTEQYPHELFPDLAWANGHLTKIQFFEYENPWASIDHEKGLGGWFKGADCRYNHMCLSNHDILVDKLLSYMIQGTPVDLTEGFKTDLVKKTWVEDQALIQNELDPRAVDHYMTNIHSRLPPKPSWRFRIGT